MSRGLYLVAASRVAEVQRPGIVAESHAHPCPGDAGRMLVYVDWLDEDAQAAWEATPGTVVLHEMLDQPLPPAALAVLTGGGWGDAWGVQAGDTVRQALRKIRGKWSPAKRVL